MFYPINSALGCLYGAACGDSLGAAVEFRSRIEILKDFGPSGISEPAPFQGFPAGSITDDTQQAIAIGQALVSACLEGLTVEAISRAAWRTLKAWRATQELPQQRRAPGHTSLTALDGDRRGSLADRLNDSDSCGAVMRVHPVGIAFAGQPDKAFAFGMATAALTHGGEEAILAAGTMAAIISLISANRGPDEAFAGAVEILEDHGDCRTLRLCRSALALPTDGERERHLAGLGKGWDAAEALAIAIYAVRCHPGDFLAAVRLAVNHDGDSDSTGSLAGAIAGAYLGILALPRDWCGRLERRSELARLATCLNGLEV